jgi:hypothetical protein
MKKHKHDFKKIEQVKLAGKLYDYYECTVEGCTATQHLIAKGQLGPLKTKREVNDAK